MANEDKKRALDAAIAKLEKDFGKGRSVSTGSSRDHSYRFIKSGSCTGTWRSTEGTYC